jgi:hypothetical protein
MIKMVAKILPALTLLLVVSQQLCAQTTVVQIEEEPRHRIVFENKYVRIYDALIPPDDVTLFHTHSSDNVTVVVSGGKGTNEFLGKPSTQMAPITGAVSFVKATNTLSRHGRSWAIHGRPFTHFAVA